MTVLAPHAIAADDSKRDRCASVSAPNRLTPDASALTSRYGTGWIGMSLAIIVVALALAALPGRVRIAPLVESDYCYLLMAADRMFDGLGPTAPLPVAPFQPWSWRADWAFLTRWPIGYPILIASVRWLFDFSTIAACRWIGLVACAAALVGWFTWIKRMVPNGVTGILLAAVSAGCAVSVASLINPSTDLLLVAAIPFLLLATIRATDETLRREIRMPTIGPDDSLAHEPETSGLRWSAAWRLAMVGLAAGGLFWIRYASVFVPIAIGLYLLFEWRRRVFRIGEICVYALCAASPIATLLLINAAYGTTESIQSQMNLGHTVGLDLSPQLVGRAWWNFAAFSFYDYHWFSHWVFALWPIGVALSALCIAPVRSALRTFVASPTVALSALTVFVLLLMLVGATAMFGDKYDFVGLDRYYTPIRPLYLALFVGPLVLFRQRSVRIGFCLGLLVACSWVVQQDWGRAYRKQQTAKQLVTPYGQRAGCFGSGAGELYRWLGDQDASDLMVVSNFHEYIALETGISALPIPNDVDTLDTWIERVGRARGVAKPRVLFILDPDNRHRDYWIDAPAEIIRNFRLGSRVSTPAGNTVIVREYRAAS